MADTSPDLWCLIEGDTRPFSVKASDVSIDELKKMIKEEAKVAINSQSRAIDAYKLDLWKVRCF
jgi:Crinkler effector protein N-terminal domain